MINQTNHFSINRISNMQENSGIISQPCLLCCSIGWWIINKVIIFINTTKIHSHCFAPIQIVGIIQFVLCDFCCHRNNIKNHSLHFCVPTLCHYYTLSRTTNSKEKKIVIQLGHAKRKENPMVLIPCRIIRVRKWYFSYS